eukprot:TRINITY_DN78170_c0_g1_i1.p1 TRINITY_DN78170_c0_g1~~TRINITY_DN78170_c0_g1_i1.p1  ORF type:complete len:226 (+),score=37.94 TRINITY_DN78170_c0_g1_i1:90-767(+)
MPAFYGSRKPKGQYLHYIRNVADFCHQSGSLLLEALLLLEWATHQFPGAILGCTGISWGGAMASCLGSLARRHNLALIPCLPSASPDVLVTGALRGEVALDRLVGPELNQKDAEQMLLGLLTAMNTADLQKFTSAFGGQQGMKIGLQISALHDDFVPPSSGREAFENLQNLDSDAQLHWVAGGHASLHAAVSWILTSRILHALRKLSIRLQQPGGSLAAQHRARL